MRYRNGGCSALNLVLTFAVLTALSYPVAAHGSVDFSQLMMDLQKTSQKADGLAMLFWIPEEFLQLSIEASGMPMPEAEAEEVLTVLRPYLIFAVARPR